MEWYSGSTPAAGTSLTGAEVEDLGESRDFLAGAYEAGLVIALPDGSRARTPYLLPYVQPAKRISVPLSSERELSRRIRRLNAAFFRSITPVLRVRDTNPAFQALARYLGFGAEMPMEACCVWHQDRLQAEEDTA